MRANIQPKNEYLTFPLGPFSFPMRPMKGTKDQGSRLFKECREPCTVDTRVEESRFAFQSREVDMRNFHYS